jgi:hypothetical protein
MTPKLQELLLWIALVLSILTFIMSLVVVLRVRGSEINPLRAIIKFNADGSPTVFALQHDGGLGVSRTHITPTWVSDVANTGYSFPHVMLSFPESATTTLKTATVRDVRIGDTWKADGTSIEDTYKMVGRIDEDGRVRLGHTGNVSLVNAYVSLQIRIYV